MKMIELKDRRGNGFVINSQLIELVECIPETKITLTTGKYFLVQDSIEDVINKVVDFNRRVYGAEREVRVRQEQFEENVEEEK